MEKEFLQLEQTMRTALETYSNVHRGSGHHARATTRIYETARKVVLGYLGLDPRKYVVIFSNPRRAAFIKNQLDEGSCQVLSSHETGLSLGVAALIVKRNALSRKIRFEPGGGTARLVGPGWVLWSKPPDRFEPGTPAIINTILFARALQMMKTSGTAGFKPDPAMQHSVEEILFRDDLEAFKGKDLLNELKKTLVGRDVLVPTAEGMKPFINLDNGASTPTFEPIFLSAFSAMCQPEEVQSKIVSEVRSVCSRFLDAPQEKYDIIFTSNTTEGINLVAESLQKEPSDGTETVIVNTIMEHNSNELPWRGIPGCSHIRVSIDKNGVIDLNGLEKILREYNVEGIHGKKRIRLFSVTGASNVLGIFNDLAAIGRIVHQYGARLLVDAAQLVAHRKADIDRDEIDYFAFSAHKVYAPFGCGVLVAKKGMLSFSNEEMAGISSSGEENITGIAALGKSMLLLERIGMEVIRQEEMEMTASLIRGMKEIPGIRIFGVSDPDSPEFAMKGGVVVFELKGIFAIQIGREMAGRAGIGVRIGCHCSHMLIKHLLKFPPALERIQYFIVIMVPGITLPGITRVSLGLENSVQDIDAFLKVLEQIAAKSKWMKKEAGKQIESFVTEKAKKVFVPQF